MRDKAIERMRKISAMLRGEDASQPMMVQSTSIIRGNLGSKMGLIRKCVNNKFCELEFKNQQNFNKMSQS